MSEIIKEYTNGEVTIVWKPKSCIHSAICVGGLPNVFNPKARPWIKTDAASTQELVDQVKQCPSGALSFYMNDEGDQSSATLETEVEALPNGPLLIYGTLVVKDKNGQKRLENKTTAFCRCGHSKNKPFCDGAHKKMGFEG